MWRHYCYYYYHLFIIVIIIVITIIIVWKHFEFNNFSESPEVDLLDAVQLWKIKLEKKISGYRFVLNPVNILIIWSGDFCEISFSSIVGSFLSRNNAYRPPYGWTTHHNEYGQDYQISVKVGWLQGACWQCMTITGPYRFDIIL